MMRLRWTNLNEQDRAAVSATIAFLNGRLEDRATVDWALGLKPNDTVKRFALHELIDGLGRRKIKEPWQFAWRLIEESWNNVAVEDYASTAVYGVQHRLRAGDKSGSLVTEIVELVAPRLKVEPFSRLDRHYLKLPKRPKNIRDLFSASLTSGRIVDLGVLRLEDLTDPSFLVALANSLDAAVFNGLDIARRIGWDGERHFWKLGQINRVYYVPVGADGEEPDEFHRGIAPSAKLLHAVVSRLVRIDLSKALDFVCRWKLLGSPVHLRLWAALSRDPLITPANEVGALVLALDDWRFWDLHDFPEIAELRAMRFSEFDPQDQIALMARIRKLPPRSQWPRKADPKEIKNSQLYCAVRELKRIETAGGTLPQRDKAWVDARIIECPELVQMTRLDEDFLDSPKACLVPPVPDNRYDLLEGEERLKALETALTSVRRGWDEDPARRARDWIGMQENFVKVLLDFESIPNDCLGFPRVWDRFGWENLPVVGQAKDGKEHDSHSECARVLSLLAKLSEDTVRQAIDGISNWLSVWGKHVVLLPEGLSVWFKVWPIAVEVTNGNEPVEEEVSFNTVAQSSYDIEPMDLDTLNAPAGKLVGVFLAACPNLQENDRPFDNVSGAPRLMRDALIAVNGRAGLISRYRMIEELSYFRKADPNWTHDHLITPLIRDNAETIPLWRAIARRTHFTEVLKIIGDKMTERANDLQLDRKTRCSLVFSLIIECLHSFREEREPAVPYACIQQMIRSLDDEVRAHGANTVQRFLRDLTAPRKGEEVTSSPEQLFRTAAVPFLQQVWPQERSLVSPGVSKALADLPATAQEAFAEAVDAIERFLVPFDCWSMLDYGLFGEEDDKQKLSSIDSHAKAAALLCLLNLTIGTAEGSVIPHDLADALDQIRKVAPSLADGQVFRRLATAARRG